MDWFSVARPRRTGVADNVVVTLAIQAVAVAVATLLDALGFSEATVVIVFVLGVLFTAVLTVGRVYSLAAAVLSILCFNYFLVEPRLSFHIEGADVPGTIAVMFVVALLASYLVMQTRKSAQESAEALLVAQNEQLRADLLRSVSHDLRTPLTAISGNADMLLDCGAELDDSDRLRLTQDIYDDATWLYGVVENLLAVTRLEDGSVALDMDVEVVNEVVEEALAHVSRDVAQHELSVKPSTELLLARMDAHMVVQVIVNLVNNAIMHTARGSHITICVRRDRDMVAVSVADDGPGVSDEDKSLVFDPFYTSGSTVVDGRRGIGLGLALCRSIVEAHGGTLRVEDACPQGAVFTFTLPLEEVPSNG